MNKIIELNYTNSFTNSNNTLKAKEGTSLDRVRKYAEDIFNKGVASYVAILVDGHIYEEFEE